MTTPDWAGAVLILKRDAKEKPHTVDLPKSRVIIIDGPYESEPGIHDPRIVDSPLGRRILFLTPRNN